MCSRYGCSTESLYAFKSLFPNVCGVLATLLLYVFTELLSLCLCLSAALCLLLLCSRALLQCVCVLYRVCLGVLCLVYVAVCSFCCFYIMLVACYHFGILVLVNLHMRSSRKVVLLIYYGCVCVSSFCCDSMRLLD